MAALTATVVITTKNRKEELRSAVASALAQSAGPEVLVIDDASTDGTAEMLRSEFPAARFERAEVSRGYIVQRNRGAALATGDIIVSIDDDAAFPSRHTIAQTLAEFDHPRVAAVAIPFVNVKQSEAVLQRAPDDGQIHITFAYIGTAHAVRRDLFLEAGGYPEFYIHQAEEQDFCIRALRRGYVTRLGRADPIHHFESVRRDFRRMDYFGWRNQVLFVWQYAPWIQVPPNLLSLSIACLMLAVKHRRYWQMPSGLMAGMRYAITHRRIRQPMPTKLFALFRRLKRQSVRLLEVEAILPPIVWAE